MTLDDSKPATACAVEALVNACVDAGQSPVELALTMLAAGADLLTLEWDAQRALAAFDLLVEIAARGRAEPTAH